MVVPHFRGASTHTREVARHLVELGHQVDLLCREGSGQAQTETLDGIRIHRIKDGIVTSNPYSSYRARPDAVSKSRGIRRALKSLYGVYFTSIYPIYAAAKAIKVVQATNSDIIFERETSFGAGALTSYLTGRALLVEIIGPRFNPLSVRRASKILYYNPSMIGGLADSHKVSKVSAAANTTLFRYNPKARKEKRDLLNLNGKTVIGYLGTFAEWQGLTDIIDASKELTKKYAQIHFLMIGPYYQDARETIVQLGLLDRFTFLGQVPYETVPEYLSATDILIAPYNLGHSPLRRRVGIGSSLKICEYMACSRPVIASSLYPISSEFQDGKDILLIRPGDVADLVKSIEKLMLNPDEMERLAEAGREVVEKKYSWAMFTRNLEKMMFQAIHSS